VASDDRKKVSIRFNGQEVSDVSQLPPEIRKIIEAAESKVAHPPPPGEPGEVTEEKVQIRTTMTESYEIDGRTYRTLDEIPPELRKLVEAATNEREGAVESVEVSSKTYQSLDEMPPELRAAAASMLSPPDAAKPRPLSGAAPVPQPWPTTSAPPPPRGFPTWLAILLSMLAGGLVMYFLSRR
jgi:hypothetical protein